MQEHICWKCGHKAKKGEMLYSTHKLADVPPKMTGKAVCAACLKIVQQGK